MVSGKGSGLRLGMGLSPRHVPPALVPPPSPGISAVKEVVRRVPAAAAAAVPAVVSSWRRHQLAATVATVAAAAALRQGVISSGHQRVVKGLVVRVVGALVGPADRGLWVRHEHG